MRAVLFKGREEMDSESLANELLRERETIARYFSETRELRARVIAYEARYSLKSDEIHQAIEEGRLQETEEVCDWIIDYEALRKRDAVRAG